jgi:hypothetical protein
MKYDQIAEAYLSNVVNNPTINIDGEAKHRYDYAGHLIHPTEQGIRNFYAWGGKHLVVHPETGKPLRFYHGTRSTEEISSFVPGGKSDSYRTGDAYGVATYATTDPHESADYAGEHGAIYPMYVRGNFLNTSADKLPKEHSDILTKYANEHLLDSDKGLFPMTRKTASFADPEEAREFLENKQKDYAVFGNGFSRNEPELDKDDKTGHFLIHHVDFNEPIKINSGSDARRLLSAVGHNSLRHMGFDGILMQRDEGDYWAISHNPEFNIKSAIGNSGEFSNIKKNIHESLKTRKNVL